MIDVYTWVTGNCHKIHIILEELGLVYQLKPINIFLGEQFAPDFLKLNPNNKIPVIVDHDGPTAPLCAVRIRRDPSLSGREDR